MNTVISADGTSIAYERMGDGPPVIVVGGALCDRTVTRPLAEHLARHFTAINYDRRGRGNSGDAREYAIEREIEDIAALIAEAGGAAAVYGHSSGAGLALRAAAHGLPITRLVLHDPPYVADVEEERRISREFAEKLGGVLSEGRRDDAVELFLATIGVPAEMIAQMRGEPDWQRMVSNAHTLRYDSEVMGDRNGGTVPFDLASTVPTPTVVLNGGANPDWMIEVGRQLAAAIPRGQHRILEGHEHVVPEEVLTPVLVEVLADG